MMICEVCGWKRLPLDCSEPTGIAAQAAASSSGRGLAAGTSSSMKMHSPGQTSAAWTTDRTCRGATQARLPDPPGSFERVTALGDVGDAVLELDEHVVAVVDAQPVAGAQVLVDPHAHRFEARYRVRGGPYPVRVIEPRAKHVAHVHHRPTGDVEDQFQWLRDRDDPDTIAYLEAENAYANAWFDERKDLVDELFEEIKSRVQETDISAPIPVDDWWYVSRTEEGLSYPIHCRGRSAADAADEVLLDENAEAGDHDFFEVGAFEVSPDHRLLAWSADVDGNEHYTLRIRDLDRPHRARRRGAGHDGVGGRRMDVPTAATCTTSNADEQERPYRVMRHRARHAAPPTTSRSTATTTPASTSTSATTRSRVWIVIRSRSNETSEILAAADR